MTSAAAQPQVHRPPRVIAPFPPHVRNTIPPFWLIGPERTRVNLPAESRVRDAAAEVLLLQATSLKGEGPKREHHHRMCPSLTARLSNAGRRAIDRTPNAVSRLS
jgi:hypothetical protein